MAKDDVIGAAGTPRQGHLYAVFADEQAAQRAEKALAARGVQLTRLRGDDDAQTLKEPAKPGLATRVERLLKKIGGESHEAQRYAEHLEHGRVVVAVPVDNRDAAVEISKMLTEQGAYDVTYFTGWAIEHTSWEADSARGLPTHTTTNTEV